MMCKAQKLTFCKIGALVGWQRAPSCCPPISANLLHMMMTWPCWQLP